MKNNPTVTVAGIKLPCVKNVSTHEDREHNFVYEVGTAPFNNIQQVALAVSCNRPVLLQGPVGSGKTSTVEFLAFFTGHRQLFRHEKEGIGFIKVQLGEQTDSRMLLGGYQSTEIPGQFVWKPGVLTKAVIYGHWILLEDIDSASSDVITVVDNLVKNQSLSVPGYGDNIIPHADFRLFATHRTLSFESSPSFTYDSLKHWFIIQLEPLNSLELTNIIQNNFPSLKSVAKRMASVLNLDYPVQSSGRFPTARDLLKWCKRCSKYYETGNFSVSLRLFQDAVDIFCGYMDQNSRSVAEQIGFELGIVKNKANFLTERYKPNVAFTEKNLIAGRCSLERRQSESIGLNRSKCMIFSLTAPSCRLIEKIACCLENNEPVLLVGETGCGKTTVLQYMAQILGRNLIVINMNQQSDTTDLIGGFKPVAFRSVMKPLCDKFETLFRELFDAGKNRDCLNKYLILIKKQNWDVLLNFIVYVYERAIDHINEKLSKFHKDCDEEDSRLLRWKTRLDEWNELGVMVQKFSSQCEFAEKSLVFSFIEGSLVKAVKRGDWVLLDEINLATSETLDCLSGLLEDSKGSLSLIEKGESQPISRDSGFRLFAAMNPATDVGKKRLPVGLRNRFTEFFIEEPNDSLDLLPLVETYLLQLNLPPERLSKIVHFYLKVKKLSKSSLLDGNGKKPHYSLRNLCRALTVASKNLCGTTGRSLYEGLNLSFLTQLEKNSYNLVLELVIRTSANGDIKALLNQTIPKPSGKECVCIEGFWITVGNLTPVVPDNYILTETVKRHLKDVIRIVSLGHGIPILLEGDTSVGKTSLINYLAKCTGNFCARVNNHEHTDIQEYIGTYVADSNGKLVFREGILCEAMRKGYWLILDELNLAPSEVLEALNRVLDDNRELYIPETQTVIKAHEKFMLFATQNPPGLYGGRKELSRAFKNRFIELQFSQIPPDELVTILERRCHMPSTYCKKMVSVMTDLQLRRRGSEIFVGKSGFITLRDLFRWGERYQKAEVPKRFHDWDQHLADEGYMLLAGRVRLQEEGKIIQDVISKHFKRTPDPNNLFSLHEHTSLVSKNILNDLLEYSGSKTEFKHVVWTFSMRRLAVLVCKALEFSEPVLLVGETGCGKTTVVQMLALMRQRNLFSVNCHTHSDSADFLGGLRPVREESRTEGKLFEWCDGPLVQAMTTGSFFLADEISLADDSVLERLNSLLEPERTILLTEKGGGLIEGDSDEHITRANKEFQFIGTMNPGGDFGKKELSPALRNRFTEIWVEVNDKRQDYLEIVTFNLEKPQSPLKAKAAGVMVDFVHWFNKTEHGKKLVISIRDLLTWINFMNASNLEWLESCIHGCCLTFLDGLGCGTAFQGNKEVIKKFRTECIQFLADGLNELMELKVDISQFLESGKFVINDAAIGIDPFYVTKGCHDSIIKDFIFNAPTTFSNALRLLRGLQMNKAILLEGSPGVGKTSLVSSLAKASGHVLTRINLSDQTDLSDLFGADLPEEGAKAGHFIWRDGPFLTALKEGHWILLDELNLALQSVLEGLNAVLDHRGSAYIPELNKTFYISKETKLFACQNPLKEGGSRRGLPKSFLNRFTQVWIEPLSDADYTLILNESFPSLSSMKICDNFIIEKMVEFNSTLCQLIRDGRIGSSGGPWEFNLRDITRWAQGIEGDLCMKDHAKLEITKCHLRPFESQDEIIKRSTFKFAEVLYFNRFRSQRDVDEVLFLFASVFGYSRPIHHTPLLYVTREYVIIGDNVTSRNVSKFFGDLNEFEMYVNCDKKCSGSLREMSEVVRLCRLYRCKKNVGDLRLLEKQYRLLSYLSVCVKMNWLAILVGEHGTGKTSSVRTLAALAGCRLKILSCNSAMDTMEILGGFEQTDYNRHLDDIAESAKVIILSSAMRCWDRGRMDRTLELVAGWLKFSQLPILEGSCGMTSSSASFSNRLEMLDGMLDVEWANEDEDLRVQASELREKLRLLKDLLTEEHGLTSGGKFEWVDSILVKCLKDGTWLLMEDVNLCSNAVLDRLNCLLEPGGSLTIGERGARSDGSLVTIKPHPNFRLFFTMNPRNGVISRAMRNRGVEIYIMPDDGKWPQQDKLALLSDSGIRDVATQTYLMELESRLGVGKVSDLVKNGFWTGQYIRHGFDKCEAASKSTQQVYRLSSEEVSRVAADLSPVLSSDRSLEISYARPPIRNYLTDPHLARMKQSCALLHFLAKIPEEETNVPRADLEYFFGDEDSYVGDVPVSDATKYSILFAYLTCDRYSLTACGYLLEDILLGLRLGPADGEPDWRQVSESLAGALTEAVPSDSELPWDVRWYENLKMLNDGLDENRTMLLLKYVFLLGTENRNDLEDMRTRLKSGQDSVTVAQYSKAVEKGLVDDSLPDHPGASRYNVFLDRFDDFVLALFKNGDVRLDDDWTSQFLNVIGWRFWLGKLGNEILLSGSKKKRQVTEDTLMQINLHFYWFNKFILPQMKNLTSLSSLPEVIAKKYLSFGEILDEMMASEMGSQLVKICNRFRHCLGQPPPDRYLPKEGEESMDVSFEGFLGDSAVMRKIVLNLVQWFHSRFVCQRIEDVTTDLRSLCGTAEETLPLVELLERCNGTDGKNLLKMSSEMMFRCLRLINKDYEFHDDIDEHSEDKYSRQVLLFHRPVITCRVLYILFGAPEKWNLTNFKRSEEELSDVLATILPHALHISDEEMNPRSNEWIKLSCELSRVHGCLKKSLGIDPENGDLREFLTLKLKEKLHPSEKTFYGNVLSTIKELSELKLTSDSGFEVIGCLWVLLGLLELLVLKGGKVDPIRKKLIKFKYAKIEVNDLQAELKTFDLNSKIKGATGDHLYIRNLKQRLDTTKQLVEKYRNLESVKREPEKFAKLCSEIELFMETFEEVLKFCGNVIRDIFHKDDNSMLTGYFYRKARYISNKTRHFIATLEREFLAIFGNLAFPLLAASSQIEHGMNLVLSELLRKPYSKNIPDMIREICTFPISEDTESRHPFHMLKAHQWHPRAVKCLEDDKLLLLFTSCSIKVNEYLTFKTDGKYDELMGIFSKVVEFWKKEEQVKAEKEREKESLYMKRGTTKCVTKSEEDELNEEQTNVFPTYDEEFEDNAKVQDVIEMEAIEGFSVEQLSQISSLHMKMVMEGVKFNWISDSVSKLSPDYVAPLRMRYLLLSHMLPHVSFLLNFDMDATFLPGLLPLIHLGQSGTLTSELVLCENDNKIYDFYKDKNVLEAVKCLDILRGLKGKCVELLEQWPEHPALVQINMIIERIMGFSIDSPLMKFLTGLELLLQGCQNWESVAHSGVSIYDHLISLTNLIIEWRKLELQGWKNCFQTAHFRMKTIASKWWFHFWCMIEEHLFDDQAKEEDAKKTSDLHEALYNFIETSPLGEYDTRLNIVLSFHCHVTRLKPSMKRDKLAVSLWNLYSFYQQYRSEVTKKLERLTAPVVKKLNDYVGIAKWNDITYWSVKQAINKSHRSLLKFIKEYEAVLKQPVQLNVMDPHLDLGIPKKTRTITQNINKFLKPLNWNDGLMTILKNSCVIHNADKKIEKAQKFCMDIILTAEYPNLILNMEFLSEQICEVTQHFKDLDVDRTLEKEKQKSQAKSIVHQKRRALADLFKTLQKIGLSFRTGLTIKEFGVLQLCDAPPMIADENRDPKTLTGEDYYMKTFSRRLTLENSLLAPSKEIGNQVIERLRGYASHIMDLNKKQKFNLCQIEVGIQSLKRYESILAEMIGEDAAVILDQSAVKNKFLRFKRYLDKTFYLVEQFMVILNSWPAAKGDKLKSMNFPRHTAEILTSSKQDDSYNTTYCKLRGIRDKLKKLRESFEGLIGLENFYRVQFSQDSFYISSDEISLYNANHAEKFNTFVVDFKLLMQNIKELRSIFNCNNIDNCLFKCFEELDSFTSEMDGIDILYPETKCMQVSVDKIRKDVGLLIESILVAIQKLLKKYKNDNISEPTKEFQLKEDLIAEDEPDEPEELIDDHFSKKLVDALRSDTRDLNLEEINDILISITKEIHCLTSNKGFAVLKADDLGILKSALPFIKQYSILCSYFLEQQKICYRVSNKLSSILIGTFILVAQKGFCIPPEYEEEGDGSGNQGNGGGGFGLGDGIGDKDVSDRIESEDQLEGAEPQGEEKEKEEDRQCKEEENGIEMSEDFDGKTQDMDRKGNEDDDEEHEEEEEPDVKEMGETEEGAEKLEKELWSSDSENEGGEEENDRKEEAGQSKGKQTIEDNYAGKENEGEEQNENNLDDRREREKDDITEINEQEDSDQIDPYHGHHEPEPEPEPFDLPDNMNLDDEEADQGEEDTENPFDIDAMKEVQPPNEPEEDAKNEEKTEEMDQDLDSSEDEESKEDSRKTENELEKMEVDDEEGEEKKEGTEIEKEESAQEKEEEESNEKNKIPEEFVPSDDKPSVEPAQPAPESEKDDLASKDQVVGSSKQPEFPTQAQEITEKPKEENKGTGQAEIENMDEGHEVGASNKEKLQAGEYNKNKERKKRERPGKSDEDRSLGDQDLSVRKKIKTLERIEEDTGKGKDDEEMEESELFQHMKENLEKAAQVVDAATKEQAESQSVPNKEEEEAEKLKEDEDVQMLGDDEEKEKDEVEEISPSDGENLKDGKKKSSHPQTEEEKVDEEMPQQIDGDVVETLTVERGPETTYHTQPIDDDNEKYPPRCEDDVQTLRLHIQEQLSNINQSECPSHESIQAWHLISSVVEDLSRDLTEQLRLILEPTKATRLKGDYRTGRRINMRRIISYIASEFRKDNIWLRRTKPWKRDHEIVLAIDDSSSMADNNSKELAFESLALVSKALTLLEAGQLGVLSFGEKTKIIHRLGDPFTEETGATLIQQFTFDQKKTLISEMLDVSSSMMTAGRKKGQVSQLLMVISDGRGVFSEGLNSVKLAVRRATDQGIFLVFVIIDDPKSKDSIMDIRMPEFKDGKFMGIKSYLEQFPFPYYLILRDISALPSTLSDALRQWFQLIISSSVS